jgi:23S rRNA (cytidine2498-2'-O)-methyltransferase
MHLLICADDSESELVSELSESFPSAAIRGVRELAVEADFRIGAGEPLPRLAFARQLLPDASPVSCESIGGWVRLLFDRIVGVLPDDQPWVLHVVPHYGARTPHRIGARAWHSATRHAGGKVPSRPAIARTGVDSRTLAQSVGPAGISADAGLNRCRLIREALLELLQKKRRQLLRRLRQQPDPFTAQDTVVQLLLTEPGKGYLSVAVAPVPFEQRHVLSCFPKGEVPLATDKAAPSRAFSKLVEAELRLGRLIQPSETCVDLGAAPGSWTYVAVNRGASVTAVDRSPLREDLMLNSRIRFVPGDAFAFKPQQTPVDWLLCDVIAPPERAASLLLEWLRRGWCRNFIVSLKLGDAPAGPALRELKREMPRLARESFLTRLCANKKELCAFGTGRDSSGRNGID